MRALPAAGFRGVNVTIPHKEAALALADAASDAARAIGAANTLTFERDGAILADNTDAPGAARGCCAARIDPAGRSALVLGAGGAARAAVWALVQARRPRRGVEPDARRGPRRSPRRSGRATWRMPGHAEIVVNATQRRARPQH